MNKPVSPTATICGEEHWTNMGSGVRLFLWNKNAGEAIDWAVRIPTLIASIAALGWAGADMGRRCAPRGAGSTSG